MIFQESSIFFIFQVFFSGNKNVHTISSFKNNILYSSYLNGSGRSQRLENSKYIDC